MPSALTTRLALAALACAICATPARAQGGLLRKMKQKAAEAAGQKAVEKAAESSGVEAPGQRTSSVTPPAPKFDDRVVEITDPLDWHLDDVESETRDVGRQPCELFSCER